ENRNVFTLAGLSLIDSPVTRAVLDADAQLQPFQCAYCKPAFILATIELLQESSQPTEAVVREAFSGLLCRCTGFQHIVDMALLAASRLHHSLQENEQ